MENYENLGTIGEGTYGIVLKARHKITGQIVAIKKFKESDEDEQVRKTALREIRILKTIDNNYYWQQLKHDNVVNLIQVFRRKGKLYLVFEYVQRTILEDLEKHPNGLTSIYAKKCLYQLVKSLEFCHSHDIIHRDIKPENLLISKNGVVKLCDFGFARMTSRPGAKYTDYVATRWYRSPELLVGDTDYGKPVDIWAVGCMFAEIINGMPLFPGESDLDQIFQIMKCFGPLTPRQMELFSKNPMYIGVKLPEFSKLQPLESRFPDLEKNALLLLKTCLMYEPKERGSFSLLLKHPYFEGFAEKFEEEQKRLIEKDNEENFQHAKKRPKKEPNTKTKKSNSKVNPGHISISHEAEKMYRALKDSMAHPGESKQHESKDSKHVRAHRDGGDATNEEKNEKRRNSQKNGSTNHFPNLRPTTPRAARMLAFPNFKAESEVSEMVTPGGRKKDVVCPSISSVPIESNKTSTQPSFGINDWSGSSYRKVDDVKVYGRKKQNPS